MRRVHIEYVCLSQPYLAGLCDTKWQVQQISWVVRVRYNAHEHVLRLRQAVSNVGQIEARGLRAGLHIAAALGNGGQHPRRIHVVGVTLVDQAAQQMGENAEVWVIEHAQDA